MMQRDAREIATDLDAGPGGRARYRTAAMIAVAVLLALGLVAAPALARSIGWDTTFSVRRLAGLAENLGKWWHTLSPGQQLALTVLAALALAIPFGFGWGLFLAGGLTYLAEHGNGAGSLLRNPQQATQDYLTNRSLGGMALDAGELALTFVPAGAGSAGGVAATTVGRDAAERYLADPVAFRAAIRKVLSETDERGSVSLDFASGLWIVNGLRPKAYRLAGKVWKGKRLPISSRRPVPSELSTPTVFATRKMGVLTLAPTLSRRRGSTRSASAEDLITLPRTKCADSSLFLRAIHGITSRTDTRCC